MTLDRLDPVIHQQTRLQIIAALYRNRRASFTDLRDGLNLTAGNLASHAARLEEAGYVQSRRVLTSAGFEAQYAITERGIDAFAGYLAALRAMLSDVGRDALGLPDKQTAGPTASDA